MERTLVEEGTKKQGWGDSDGELKREVPEENVGRVEEGALRAGRSFEGCRVEGRGSRGEDQACPAADERLCSSKSVEGERGRCSVP